MGVGGKCIGAWVRRGSDFACERPNRPDQLQKRSVACLPFWGRYSFVPSSKGSYDIESVLVVKRIGRIGGGNDKLPAGAFLKTLIARAHSLVWIVAHP